MRNNNNNKRLQIFGTRIKCYGIAEVHAYSKSSFKANVAANNINYKYNNNKYNRKWH